MGSNEVELRRFGGKATVILTRPRKRSGVRLGVSARNYSPAVDVVDRKKQFSWKNGGFIGW